MDISVNIDLMRPYFLHHFRGLRIWESATPVDYDTIVNDLYFQNTVDYRLEVLRINRLDSYRRAMEKIRVVLDLLDREISSPKSWDEDREPG
jgi:hypothetical protein